MLFVSSLLPNLLEIWNVWQSYTRIMNNSLILSKRQIFHHVYLFHCNLRKVQVQKERQLPNSSQTICPHFCSSCPKLLLRDSHWLIKTNRVLNDQETFENMFLYGEQLVFGQNNLLSTVCRKYGLINYVLIQKNAQNDFLYLKCRSSQGCFLCVAQE